MKTVASTTMEDNDPTARQTNRGDTDNQGLQTSIELGSSKPLHRYLKGEPKSLGIVILFFGCAEMLMGFSLSSETEWNSSFIYIPFWQGLLFIIAGVLSIYTGAYPSKKMVTVSLAMYIISLLGMPVSIIYRCSCFFNIHYDSSYESPYWAYRTMQLLSIEAVLFVSSFCVAILLIFLTTMARVSLKSTNTQVIVQHTLPVMTDRTAS